MSNSINPVNPMMPPLQVDQQDHAKAYEVVELCEIFMGAVMDDFDAQGRPNDLDRAMTQNDIAETQYLLQAMQTMPATSDQELADGDLMGIALCDIFAEVVGRVEPDDDKIAKHIPLAMATRDTEQFLKKYGMDALAHYVDCAIP